MDIKKSVEKIFNFINMIPVQGDGVELMHAAKMELKTLYNELVAEEERNKQA